MIRATLTDPGYADTRYLGLGTLKRVFQYGASNSRTYIAVGLWDCSVVTRDGTGNQDKI
jgi:hypothetical protein